MGCYCWRFQTLEFPFPCHRRRIWWCTFSHPYQNSIWRMAAMAQWHCCVVFSLREMKLAENPLLAIEKLTIMIATLKMFLELIFLCPKNIYVYQFPNHFYRFPLLKPIARPWKSCFFLRWNYILDCNASKWINVKSNQLTPHSNVLQTKTKCQLSTWFENHNCSNICSVCAHRCLFKPAFEWC